MIIGAQSPEELEFLLEDSLLLGDLQLLTRLFSDEAVLVIGEEIAKGLWDIANLALVTWKGDNPYIADLRRVIQVQDLALIFSKQGVNIMRLSYDGSWKYIVLYRS